MYVINQSFVKIKIRNSALLFFIYYLYDARLLKMKMYTGLFRLTYIRTALLCIHRGQVIFSQYSVQVHFGSVTWPHYRSAFGPYNFQSSMHGYIAIVSIILYYTHS